MTPREFIQRIVAVSSTGSVNDEAISNLSINTEASSLSEDTFKNLFEAWDSFPAYFSGFRLIADDQRLFELSGRELSVNDEGLEALADRDLDPAVDVDFYRRGFDRYYPDEIRNAAGLLYEFASELTDASTTVTIEIGLQKGRIASELLGDELTSDFDLNPLLWWTPSDLFEWIGSHSPHEVALSSSNTSPSQYFSFSRMLQMRFSLFQCGPRVASKHSQRRILRRLPTNILTLYLLPESSLTGVEIFHQSIHQ